MKLYRENETENRNLRTWSGTYMEYQKISQKPISLFFMDLKNKENVQ